VLLGLGGGIGFIYWYVKRMPAPFINTKYGKGCESILKRKRGEKENSYPLCTTKTKND